jgi:AraC-like DNA-binding protein
VACDEAISPVYCSFGKNRRFDTHCCLFFVLSGEVEVWNAFGRWRVQKNHVFISVINDPQSGYRYPQDGREPYRVLWFGFDGGGVRQTMQEIIRRFGTVFPFDPSHSSVRSLLAFQSTRPRSRIFDPLEGAQFVADIIGGMREVLWSPNRHLSLVQRALKLKEEHALNPLPVKELAVRLGISREHLSRLFREMQGTSLGRNLQEQRLREACRLLREGTLSVKVIAARLRYTSSSNFTRAFRKEMRVTPLEFRHDSRGNS